MRCSYCVDKEVVSWFCSMCLFEVTQSAAVKNGNKCLRNCLKCPCCRANLVVSTHGDTYSARCANCEYKYDNLHKGGTLASQVDAMSLDERLETLRTAFVDGQCCDLSVEDSAGSDAQPLPQLAPLRARYSKYCKYCRNLMVNPDPQPGSAKMLQLTMARSMVPEIYLLDREEGAQMWISNPTPLNVNVSLASTADVKFMAPQISLSPSTGKRDDKTLIRGVPEMFVSRETTASRQVFMEGSRKQRSGIQKGASWALIDLDIPPELSKFTTQVSVNFVAGDENMAITLWLSCQRDI